MWSQQKAILFIDGIQKEELLYSDTLELIKSLRNLERTFLEEGYFFSGVDSVVVKNENNIYFHRGEKYKLQLDRKNGLRVAEKRIKYLTDHGYPFASLRFKPTHLDDNLIDANIEESKGPFIAKDSAFFYNDIKTKHSYLYQLLDYVPGTSFSENGYERITDRIERVSFLSLKRPVDVSFQNGKAKIYLDLKEEKTNTFEGIIGLQQQGSENNIVGSFDLHLENLFRSGKNLDLQWESFAGQSQSLALGYEHPFIFGSKISPVFQFDLLRQDSTFIRRSTKLGFGIYLFSKTTLFLEYQNNNASLLTTEIEDLRNLDIADFESDNYSLKVERGNQSFQNELKSDYAWSAAVGIGNKIISRNPDIADQFYDTLELNTNVFQLDLGFIFQKEIAKTFSFFQTASFSIIENNALLNNERYRIGGLNSLRGFNEKSIFADKYFLSRTELRSFFERGSFLYLFYDQLFYSNGDFNDAPKGTGIGFSLKTLSGQFNFALAIGDSKNQSLDFSNLKAHFGFVAKF